MRLYPKLITLSPNEIKRRIKVRQDRIKMREAQLKAKEEQLKLKEEQVLARHAAEIQEII